MPQDNPPYTVQGWLLEESTPAERRTLVESGLESLAAVHAVDWRPLGLESLSKPQYGAVGFEQQLRYYERSFEWAEREAGVPGPGGAPGRARVGTGARPGRRPGDHAVLG